MAKKDLKLMSSEALMAYSNIFENAFNQCIMGMNEVNEYIEQGFFKKEEVENVFAEMLSAHNEYKSKMIEIRQELDVRLKSNFGVKYSLDRVQGIFGRFSQQVMDRDNKLTEAKKRLDALQKSLKTEEDDNSTEQNN